jgi:eukaryotic-like serine/threonine-protein kinase
MSIEHFLKLLVSSGLSNNKECDELLAGFREQSGDQYSPDNLDSFCRFLIATNLFTEWQCSKLRVGKWKGFYLDNYLLLDQIGKDEEFAYYRARDTRDGKLVRMTITPMAHSNGPGIEYRVEHYNE